MIGSFVLGVPVCLTRRQTPAFIFTSKYHVIKEDSCKGFSAQAQPTSKEGGGKYLAGGFNKAVNDPFPRRQTA